jgi:hypothetical protein
VVAIYDVVGRLVTQLPIQSGKAIWNPTHLPSGIYFLKLKGTPNTMSSLCKLIKLE